MTLFLWWATYIHIFFGNIHNIVTTTVTNSTGVEPVSHIYIIKPTCCSDRRSKEHFGTKMSTFNCQHRQYQKYGFKKKISRRIFHLGDKISTILAHQQYYSVDNVHFWPVFCLLRGASSGCVWPITGQVTSVTWPVIGWAESDLTPSKRQKTGSEHIPLGGTGRVAEKRFTEKKQANVRAANYVNTPYTPVPSRAAPAFSLNQPVVPG